jgi:hypothetical protein
MLELSGGHARFLADRSASAIMPASDLVDEAKGLR